MQDFEIVEGLLTLIIGVGGLVYVIIWYEGYTKQRENDRREREQASRDARDVSERLGARRERARIALENHRREVRIAAEREELEHAAWITRQTADVERSTDEAWQESPVLAPLHRHWWRLVDAATLHIAQTISDENDRPAAPPNLDELADELAADDEWDDLDEADRYELLDEILHHEFIEDDDRAFVLPSTEYLREALNVAIAALAQHRTGDATLIERALAGQADIPEFFCGAEHLTAILDTIGDSWPERHPEFARESFQNLR